MQRVNAGAKAGGQAEGLTSRAFVQDPESPTKRHVYRPTHDRGPSSFLVGSLICRA